MSLSNVDANRTTGGSAVSLVDHAADAGLITLAPVEASVSREEITVALRLGGGDGQLRLGDLRSAAFALDERAEFEAAHRLWIIVGTAALAAGDLLLATRADQWSERSLRQAKGEAAGAPARLVKYDYDELVAARQSGLSIAATAERWNCSPTTVKRASQYVEVRDAMLDDKPGLISAIEAGVDVSDLASRFDVEPKIMRWIVMSHFDRRAMDRDA